MAEIEDLKIVGGSTYTVGNQDIIANEWEAGKTYVKGKSYVIREHKLYVCNVTHTSVEPFDATKWTEITIGDAIGNNIGDLSTLTTTDKSSLVGAVNEVNANKPTNTNTNPMFKRLVCSDIAVTISANGSKAIIGNDVNLSPAGYSPVAICAMYTNLSNSCAFTSFDAKYTSGVGTFCNIKNLTSSSVTGMCNFTVLFARNDVFAQS